MTAPHIDEERLIELALADPELAGALADLDVSRVALADDLRARLPRLREAATTQRQALEQAVRDRNALPDPKTVRTRRTRLMRVLQILRAIVIVLVVLGVVGVIAAVYVYDTDVVIGELRSRPVVLVLGGVTGVLGLAVLFWAGVLSGRHAAEVRALRGEVQGHLDAADAKIAGARATYEEQLLRGGLVTELRELISQYKMPDYRVELPPVRARGLGEVFDPSYEVQTLAKARVRRLLESMSGASIGIAGPRGAGKSTLMSYFCGGRLEQLGDRKVLSIMVSAPVEYDAREFILHLFASLCRQILTVRGAADQAVPPRVRPIAVALARMRTLALPVVAGTGALLIGAALLLAWAQSSVPAPGDGGGTSFEMALVSGVGAGAFLFWGSIMLVASYVFMIWRSSSRDRASEKEPEPPPPPAKPAAPDPLVVEARTWLERIRFQQSFSSGWSGSLSLPLGIGAELTGAESLAQNQLSLPEIVEGLRAVVQQAAQGYAVVIGIDELDKLESDEKAYQFVNDIKAVFGVPHAFYVLAVSENAMSSFERRGLPFRDAFDSAFDTIVYADYMNLEEATRLLRRRVVGMPYPFKCVCYALSGGLPRDLLRVARGLLHTASDLGPSPSLDAVVEHVIRDEIQAKVRAVLVATRRVALLEQASELQIALHAMERIPITPHALRTTSDALMARGDAIQDLPGSDDTRAAREALAALSHEMGAFVGYCAVLLDEVGRCVPGTVEQMAADQFPRLAAVRQGLALHPQHAFALVRTFPLWATPSPVAGAP